MKNSFWVEKIEVKGTRKFQEDFSLVEKSKGFFAIADGFGDASSEEKASRIACESVLEFLRQQSGDREATLPFVLRKYYSLAGNVLFNGLVLANQKILEVNKSREPGARGGASVLAGLLDKNTLAFANAGACSAWLFRDGHLWELVRPRNMQRLIDPTRDDLTGHCSIPLVALGLEESFEPEVTEVRVRKNDWVLLHSDGFDARVRKSIFDLKKTGAITSSVQLKENFEKIVNTFVFHDNASAILTAF